MYIHGKVAQKEIGSLRYKSAAISIHNQSQSKITTVHGIQNYSKIVGTPFLELASRNGNKI